MPSILANAIVASFSSLTCPYLPTNKDSIVFLSISNHTSFICLAVCCFCSCYCLRYRYAAIVSVPVPQTSLTQRGHLMKQNWVLLNIFSPLALSSLTHTHIWIDGHVRRINPNHNMVSMSLHLVTNTFVLV